MGLNSHTVPAAKLLASYARAAEEVARNGHLAFYLPATACQEFALAIGHQAFELDKARARITELEHEFGEAKAASGKLAEALGAQMAQGVGQRMAEELGTLRMKAGHATASQADAVGELEGVKRALHSFGHGAGPHLPAAVARALHAERAAADMRVAHADETPAKVRGESRSAVAELEAIRDALAGAARLKAGEGGLAGNVRAVLGELEEARDLIERSRVDRNDLDQMKRERDHAIMNGGAEILKLRGELELALAQREEALGKVTLLEAEAADLRAAALEATDRTREALRARLEEGGPHELVIPGAYDLVGPSREEA